MMPAEDRTEKIEQQRLAELEAFGLEIYEHNKAKRDREAEQAKRNEHADIK